MSRVAHSFPQLCALSASVIMFDLRNTMEWKCDMGRKALVFLLDEYEGNKELKAEDEQKH